MWYMQSPPRREDHRGVDLISDVLPFGRLWYDTSDNAIGYAMHSRRSHDAVIRVYDSAGNVIETHIFAALLSCSLLTDIPSMEAEIANPPMISVLLNSSQASRGLDGIIP